MDHIITKTAAVNNQLATGETKIKWKKKKFCMNWSIQKERERLTRWTERKREVKKFLPKKNINQFFFWIRFDLIWFVSIWIDAMDFPVSGFLLLYRSHLFVRSFVCGFLFCFKFIYFNALLAQCIRNQ